jgi:hypothetical protein
MGAMGEGDPRTGRRPEGSGDARDDLEGDAFRGQGLCLFAAPAEYKRIASLQANDPFPLAGEGHEDGIDFGLRAAMESRSFSDEHALTTGRGFRQDSRPNQAIVNHGIGLPEQSQRLQREKLGIAGTGAHQVDGPGKGRGYRRFERVHEVVFRRARSWRTGWRPGNARYFENKRS